MYLQHVFARKILPKTDRLEERLEKEFLRAMSRQNHRNIIELLFFYEWRAQYIFVFPFVEGNLQKVLHDTWHPAETPHSPPGALKSHWLWKEMVCIADALKTIHNPPNDASDIGYGNKPIIGFHFDLKPANILVSSDGTLQITDFGQALLKFVDKDDLTYGIHRGGSLVYQAPETCPTSTSQGQEIDRRMNRRYDVWSLACIILEVLVFILEKGTNALEQFEEERRKEPIQGAFYTGNEDKKLKQCVEQRLAKYKRQGTVSSGHQVYLNSVLDLLSKMFSVDQRKRPSSAVVQSELERFAKGKFSMILEGVSQEQKKEWLTNFPITKGFVELCWEEGSEAKSFLDAYANFDRPFFLVSSINGSIRNTVTFRLQGHEPADRPSYSLRLLLNEGKRLLRLIRFRDSQSPQSFECRDVSAFLIELEWLTLYSSLVTGSHVSTIVHV